MSTHVKVVCKHNGWLCSSSGTTKVFFVDHETRLSKMGLDLVTGH